LPQQNGGLGLSHSKRGHCCRSGWQTQYSNRRHGQVRCDGDRRRHEQDG
jgi:hypothetical protein